MGGFVSKPTLFLYTTPNNKVMFKKRKHSIVTKKDQSILLKEREKHLLKNYYPMYRITLMCLTTRHFTSVLSNLLKNPEKGTATSTFYTGKLRLRKFRPSEGQPARKGQVSKPGLLNPKLLLYRPHQLASSTNL